MGGFYVVIGPTEGKFFILAEHGPIVKFLLYETSRRRSRPPHGPSAHPCFFVPPMSPSLSTPAFSSYVIDDSIHNHP